MDFIGQINGMNLNPISNYNNFLNQTHALDVDIDNTDFENVLNQQTQTMQTPSIHGGVQLNKMSDVAVQNTIQPMSNDISTGDVLGSFSKSISSGLNSVNNNVIAADRAQEAFAAGENVSVHDVMIAAEKSALSMQMAMQLRNKMMTAYTELNNIRV